MKHDGTISSYQYQIRKSKNFHKTSFIQINVKGNRNSKAIAILNITIYDIRIDCLDHFPDVYHI